MDVKELAIRNGKRKGCPAPGKPLRFMMDSLIEKPNCPRIPLPMQASHLHHSDNAESAPDGWSAEAKILFLEQVAETPKEKRLDFLTSRSVTQPLAATWIAEISSLEIAAGRMSRYKIGQRTDAELEKTLRQIEANKRLNGTNGSATEHHHLPESVEELCASLEEGVRAKLARLFHDVEVALGNRVSISDRIPAHAQEPILALRRFLSRNGILMHYVFKPLKVNERATYCWANGAADHDAEEDESDEEAVAEDSDENHPSMNGKHENGNGVVVRTIDVQDHSATEVVIPLERVDSPVESELAEVESEPETAVIVPTKKKKKGQESSKSSDQPSWVRDRVDSRPFDEAKLHAQREKAEGVRRDAGLIIEGDPKMDDVWLKTILASRSNGQVLIRGESGTGKELIFKAIHLLRQNGKKTPSAQVNCAAIPKDLAESILFGHKKGAFTGAHENKDGLFHVVKDGGVIFLDEIGDMDLPLQAKLLRIIQERKFSPVGSSEEVSLSADTKIVASTHRNLESMMRGRRFREDLFHRLSGQQIFVPSLRERSAEHKTALIGHFLEKISTDTDRTTFMTQGAYQAMLQFEHTGNVRQLSNHMRAAAGLAGLNTEGEILIEESHTIGIFEHATALGTPDVTWTNYFDRILRIGADRHGGVHFSVNVKDMDAAGGGVTMGRLIEAIDTAIISAAVENNRGIQSVTADQVGLTRGTVRDRVTRASEILQPDEKQDD